MFTIKGFSRPVQGLIQTWAFQKDRFAGLRQSSLKMNTIRFFRLLGFRSVIDMSVSSFQLWQTRRIALTCDESRSFSNIGKTVLGSSFQLCPGMLTVCSRQYIGDRSKKTLNSHSAAQMLQTARPAECLFNHVQCSPFLLKCYPFEGEMSILLSGRMPSHCTLCY